MYYPFLRGKQFELIMLREMAPKIAQWGFVPIIEPVKGNFPALKRALDELINYNCRFILVGNPIVGELQRDNSSLKREIIEEQLSDYRDYSIGLNLTSDDNLDNVKLLLEHYPRSISLIHRGFSDGSGLVSLIESKNPEIINHVFVESESSLYRRHFRLANAVKVIIKDGFQNRINRDYPESELFSEIYLTFQEYSCNAFGDFLIVGREYNDGGGPAYAIAIHLTYKDSNADNAIAIRHFVSDRVDTPKDPAGKFIEALEKLYEYVEENPEVFDRTTALEEYLELYRKQHFPGLGYVKKLSMRHHIELMGILVGGEA